MPVGNMITLMIWGKMWKMVYMIERKRNVKTDRL